MAELRTVEGEAASYLDQISRYCPYLILGLLFCFVFFGHNFIKSPKLKTRFMMLEGTNIYFDVAEHLQCILAIY